jgi:hypothetical protein
MVTAPREGAWAFANGVDWGLCRNALDYLRGDAVPAFGYYHDTDLVEGRPARAPLHCLAIDANPVSGLILGYGEYFGFQRFVCLLGENYVGPAIRGAYALDRVWLTFGEGGFKALEFAASLSLAAHRGKVGPSSRRAHRSFAIPAVTQPHRSAFTKSEPDPFE